MGSVIDLAREWFSRRFPVLVKKRALNRRREVANYLTPRPNMLQRWRIRRAEAELLKEDQWANQ